MRVAILDDYQQVALDSTDWSGVRELAGITVFTEHIVRTEALLRALEPFDVVVAMRERTAFPESLLKRLAWRQRCGNLVTHKVSSSCLRPWGNSPHSRRLPSPTRPASFWEGKKLSSVTLAPATPTAIHGFIFPRIRCLPLATASTRATAKA